MKYAELKLNQGSKHISIMDSEKCRDSRIRKTHHIVRGFIVLCTLILSVTAGSKILSIVKDIPILLQPDPLLGIVTIRQAISIAAGLEIAVLYLIWQHGTGSKVLLGILWISSIFLLYRFGLHAIGYRGFCPCLGAIHGWSNAGHSLADRFSLFSAMFMMIGSFLALLVARNIIQSCNKPAIAD